MINNYFLELVISTILILLTIFLLNPFHFWMPNEVHMIALVVTILVFLLFAIFIWKEKSADERQERHKAVAGRFAYLTGSAVLVFGIVMQSIAHTLDPWLIVALCAMVIAKVIGLIVNDLNN